MDQIYKKKHKRMMKLENKINLKNDFKQNN
jgi:hypothetical protein